MKFINKLYFVLLLLCGCNLIVAMQEGDEEDRPHRVAVPRGYALHRSFYDEFNDLIEVKSEINRLRNNKDAEIAKNLAKGMAPDKADDAYYDKLERLELKRQEFQKLQDTGAYWQCPQPYSE
jgi:hypothetical protein